MMPDALQVVMMTEWQADEWSPQCRKWLRKFGWDQLRIMSRDCWSYWYKDCPLLGQLARGARGLPGVCSIITRIKNRPRLRDGGRRWGRGERGPGAARLGRCDGHSRGPGPETRDLSGWQHSGGGGHQDKIDLDCETGDTKRQNTHCVSHVIIGCVRWEGMVLIDSDHWIGHWKTINKYENMMQNAPDSHWIQRPIWIHHVCWCPSPAQIIYGRWKTFCLLATHWITIGTVCKAKGTVWDLIRKFLKQSLFVKLKHFGKR